MKEITTVKELAYEFGEFHHEWCNKYGDARYKKIYSYIQKLEKEQNKINLLQQLAGFKLGKWGADIKEILIAAGVKEGEWYSLKEDFDVQNLDEKDKIEANDYFKEVRTR